MSAKTKNIIAWVLSGFLALAFISAGAVKLMGAESQVLAFQSWGYPSWSMYPIGIVEILLALAIIIPKYRIMGTNLLYFWGLSSLFTHLQADPAQYDMIGPNIIFPIIGYIIRVLTLSSRKELSQS